MVDRAPTKPNRYAVYDDAHNFVRYEYHERADEPTQVGDALNKANLLPDTVATALGLTGNPQVKDALEKLKTLVNDNTTLANSKAKIATGSYTGTNVCGESNPNSLTFPFAPKIVWVFAYTSTAGALINSAVSGSSSPIVFMDWLTTTYTAKKPPYRNTVNGAYAKKSADGKTLNWYHADSADYQLNGSYTYYYLAIA